jgi:hypothetical protein
MYNCLSSDASPFIVNLLIQVWTCEWGGIGMDRLFSILTAFKF